MKHFERSISNKAEGNINSDRQETDTVNRDEEISACFERAKKKLDRLLTSKKQVVRDLARELERLGRRTEDIAAEIVAELSGCEEISKSLIYEYLDDKYKDAAHASRRKGKKTKKPVPETGTEPAREVPPLVITTSASGQEVVESTPESQAKTNEIASSGDNTYTSPLQSEQQNNSNQSSTFESENHTDHLLPSSSPQHFEWRECSFPTDDVRNMVSAASENQDKFCFCVKLDRPATILDLRLGRLNGEDLSHD